MNDLKKLWEIGGLVEDQNGDGVADRVNVSFNIPNDLKAEGLVDFCARLGFETTSLSFDFLKSNQRYPIVVDFQESHQETSLVIRANRLLFLFETEESLSTLLRFLAAKWPVNELTDNNGEKVEKISLQMNSIAIHTDIGEKLVDHTWDIKPSREDAGEKKVAASLTDFWNGMGFLHMDEPSPENKRAVTFEFDETIDQTIFKEICYGAARVGMASTSLTFPVTGSHSLSATTFTIEKSMGKGANISLSEGDVRFKGDESGLVKALSYFFKEKHWSEGGHFASWENDNGKTERQEKELFSVNWEDKGELHDIYKHLDHLSDYENESGTLAFNLFISEPRSVRKKVANEIKQRFPHATVNVRSSFKPGFFWIVEEVLPALKKKSDIDSILINCLKEERNDGLELPIRWIQEIYPVDEVLANELSIHMSKVNLGLNETQDFCYVVTANNKHGQEIFRDQLNVPVSKVPYVEAGQFSYPTTSYITVQNEDVFLIDQLIKTDRERFYEFYLEDVLPRLFKNIEAETVDNERGFTKPLFDRIDIDVEMSEEELELSVQEERVSSLEALHEDLYFNTLDYFGFMGKEVCGKEYTAPGGIYPYMKVRPGSKPKAKIVAYSWIAEQANKNDTKQLTFNHLSDYPIEASYSPRDTDDTNAVQISQSYKRDSIPHGVPYPEKAEIRLWLADHSYRGSPIYVYEFFSKSEETHYSPIKLSAYKPTVLIETGHHANEVSSMPAVTEMLDEISTKHPDILLNMNIVVIPCANPDGSRLHENMVKENPKWKHHAARYNAVGLEFTHVRYLNTIFGEANVVPKIMNRWAPDIIIDDHGIPSHEWTQPFAGYHIPPRFQMSFWIPNALIYGISRQLDPKMYPQHNQVLEKIIGNIQKKVDGTDIADLNDYWLSRYKKYGHAFMPELFPLELTNNFIFYKWPTKPDPNNPAAISRFPEWVSADIISEAADETVYDHSLEVCKRAHRWFDLGAVNWIKKDEQELKRSKKNNVLKVERKRPLNVVGGINE
ncbi:M14 family metallopeptidase [Evansella halocellulosilytica]|uniref:M14 family metallopeptidase n=1 Tax=Evansella halocellulosilytica TaxID=2011013 RepID=UPI000BB8911E|nr:M14 family metallopeptidase [Evansella halocellulosilytica]